MGVKLARAEHWTFNALGVLAMATAAVTGNNLQNLLHCTWAFLCDVSIGCILTLGINVNQWLNEFRA